MDRSKTARLAAILWLLTCATQAFSLAYVRPRLMVWSDTAATAANLAANESLFRSAIASYLLSQLFLFLFGLIAFQLFREVSRLWSSIFVASVVVTVSVAVANAMNNIAALVISTRPDFLGSFTHDQLTSMTMLFLRVNNQGQGVLEIFWLPYMFALGMLIVRSRYVPRVFGVILMIAAFGFAISTFAGLVSPGLLPTGFGDWVGIIAAFGTVPTIGWLLAKGASE